MATIKDKLDDFSSQVSGFMELPPEPEASEDAAKEGAKVYEVVEPEDDIDVMVSAAMTQKFAGITISR